jgi:hypothetical protein
VSSCSQTANDPNLLREVIFNIKFSASSDISAIVGVTSFLYTMTVILVVCFFIIAMFWVKAHSADPESALSIYMRYGVMLNSIVV